MRELGRCEYGCSGFVATAEYGVEIAISYWKSLEDISAWKSNPDHQRAQALGKSRWYKSIRYR